MALRDGVSSFKHGAAHRGGLLSLLVQRKKQRNTPQAARPPRCALRVRERAGNFRKAHPCAIRKRRPSRAAPCGFYPTHSPCLMGAQKPRATACTYSESSFFISGAPEVRQSWRVKPCRGGAQGCAPFSAGAGCLVRKFPPRLRTRRAAAGGPPWGVSFAYFSLHKQRKVGPPRRAAACLNKRRSVPQGHRTRGHRGRGDNTGRPEDTDFVAPHPNPSPGGREA